MTVWAYYRVSTDKQDYESQKVGVVDYCQRAGLIIDKEIIDDGVSGIVDAKKRKLGKILKEMKTGDTIITGELSRFGRSISDVIHTCNLIVQKGVDCYLVKQGMKLDKSPTGKMLIAIMGAFAEMERDLLSMRTKEGLARRKAMGLHIGGKAGRHRKYRIFDQKKEQAIELYEKDYSAYKAADVLHCSSSTVRKIWAELGLKAKYTRWGNKKN